MSGVSVSDEKFDSYQYQYDNRAGSYTLLQPKVSVKLRAGVHFKVVFCFLGCRAPVSVWDNQGLVWKTLREIGHCCI